MARRSGYLHVHEHHHSGTAGKQPWMVKIKTRGHPSGIEEVTVGYFGEYELEHAAWTADVACRMLFGPNAREKLNFPPEEEPPVYVTEPKILRRLTERGYGLEHLFLGGS